MPNTKGSKSGSKEESIHSVPMEVTNKNIAAIAKDYSDIIYDNKMESLQQWLDGNAEFEQNLAKSPNLKSLGLSGLNPKRYFQDQAEILFERFTDRIKGYTNEIVENAKIDVKLSHVDPYDTDSRRTMDINIQLTSELLDKYDGLISYVVKEKKIPESKPMIHQAHDFIENTRRKLRKIKLISDVHSLFTRVDLYLKEHPAMSCLPFFGPHPSNKIKRLLSWTNQLVEQGVLSEHELLGAVYSLKGQLKHLSGKERTGFEEAINNILSKNHYTLDVGESQAFIKDFYERSHVLAIKWPQGFDEVEPQALTVL